MSNDQRLQYEDATALTQDYLNASQDNLVNRLELIVDIEKPGGGFIRASDRNKYVVSPSGEGVFYEALLNFPTIKRTVGEFLSPQLEFSTLELELSNVDERFNPLLPAGDDFSGWVGKSVTVRLGIGEIESTYFTIFEGIITDQGGFRRNVSSITIIARDRLESVNKSFPSSVFTVANYPDLEKDKENAIVPVIYGDWTVSVEDAMASIPAIVVNGADPDVNGSSSFNNNIQCVVASHALVSLDTSSVYLSRGIKTWLVDSSDISAVSIGGPGVSSFEIAQDSVTMTAQTPDTDDQALEFGSGDAFFVKVKGLDLGVYDDNIVAQARDILETYGGLTVGDFDSNWDTYRDKSTPSESAISTFKSRAWIGEGQNVLEFVLSMLEQVRIEAFIDKNLKFKLLALHLEDFTASPAFTVKNWDVGKGSFNLKIDERTNFNRARAAYNFLPNRNENLQETPIYKNDAAISQAGKAISKKIVFPNLYEEAAVIYQLIETLKITSAYFENLDVALTWRAMLLDIGDFVKLNVKIQSSQFESVPALIREVGYDPEGIKIPMRLWSCQLLPFPGYIPGYNGTVGGYTATIDAET